MFDPIIGPPDEFRGPSVGHTTEFGDSYHCAVRKINEGFANVVKALDHGTSVEVDVETVDVQAREAFKKLREAHDKLARDNADLATKFDSLSTDVDQMKVFIANLSGPDPKPSAVNPNLKPPDQRIPANTGQPPQQNINPDDKPAGADPKASEDAVAKALNLG